jgi:hypothetical protein
MQAKTQKVVVKLVVPASIPAKGEPRACPAARSKNAAPRPADGRSPNTETDQTRITPDKAM